MRTAGADQILQRALQLAENLAEAVGLWARLFGKVLTWDDMAWLKSITRLPIVLKGICHPYDARRAVDAGADGIFCSNHGGRQANGRIAAIDMLAVLDVNATFTRVNASFERTLGHAAGVMVGAPLVQFVHPDDVAMLQAQFSRLIDDRAEMAELRFAAADGTWRKHQMPAYHLMAEGESGITLVNIGVGPSNAKNICDHLAVLRLNGDLRAIVDERDDLEMAWLAAAEIVG